MGKNSDKRPMRRIAIEKAEKAVVDAAVLFCETEDAQTDFAELEGSNSASIPAEYILLGKAVKLLQTARIR